MPTVSEVAAVVAENVHVASDDAAVVSATEAAWQFAAVAVGLTDDATTPTPIPDDPIVSAGLVGFARAVYLDRIASRGSQVALGDSVTDTVFTPEDPWRHWRHYFAHLTRSWGVA